MNRHIYLIGYRGSGKTSVGRMLAAMLQWPAADSDAWVEQHSDSTIREIFHTQGEDGFRELEIKAIETLSQSSHPSVLSLGGGAILRKENVLRIRESGWIVWLKASPENLDSRILADLMTADRRPALTNLVGRKEIQNVLAIRSPIYASVANISVDTDDRSTKDIAEEIYRIYQSEKLSLHLTGESQPVSSCSTYPKTPKATS